MERITRKDILREIVNTVAFVALLAFLGFIFLVILPAMNTASAATLDNRCYAFYEAYQQHDAYTDAQRLELADAMDDFGCWPELQNTQQSTSATGWDCDSLGAFVKENGDASWQKMYTPESVVLYNDERSLLDALKSKTSAEERSPVYHHFSNRDKVVSKTEVPPGGVRAVECIAQVRTGHGNQKVYYYLDRDSEGDEFWGWLYL